MVQLPLVLIAMPVIFRAAMRVRTSHDKRSLP
jgi:hypothetical protein